jgi:hypothetical protein
MPLGLPGLAPALVLSVVVGVFHASLYLTLRGRLRPHVLLVYPAAIVGAWVGQAVGSRLGDALRLGDYSIVWASLVAWAGIGLVVGASMLLPSRPRGEDTDP